VPKQHHDEPGPDGLRLTRRHVGTALIITAAGEIDLRTAPDLQATVHNGLDDPATAVCVLDLTDVTFLGSHGLAALLEATEHAQHRREPLRIVVDATQPVIRPIQVTGLDHRLALYHTVDQALAAGPTADNH
jgi:anti-sigma B factor antagonist